MTQAVEDVTLRRLAPDWSVVRRVLLIRLRSIGDTVLMTPCLEALKSWRPDIDIAALCEPLSAPVLEDHPSIDDLIITRADFGARAQIIAALRRRRFDVAFNLHGGTTATIIARLSGARHSIGYRGYRQSWMLSHRAPSPDAILGRCELHSLEQQLALLHWAGVPWPASRPRLSLAVSEEADARLLERLRAIGLCVSSASGIKAASDAKSSQAAFAIVAPAAAFESKRWPAQGFAAVANHLSEKWGLPSVIIAGREQEHVAREVASNSRAGARAITGLTLKELMALIRRSEIFVGNDSGPMHIAAAFDRPVVAVFGSSEESVWHPWTDAPYRTVKKHFSQSSDQKGKRSATAESLLSLHGSWPSANEVIAAVDDVLKAALAASFTRTVEEATAATGNNRASEKR